MSPEIRSLRCKRNEQMYVELNGCKAHNRFWMTQCYHCQGFGHMSSRCSRKEEPPTCLFCVGWYESRTCSSRSLLAVATVLSWRITLAQLSTLPRAWTVQWRFTLAQLVVGWPKAPATRVHTTIGGSRFGLGLARTA